MLKHLIDMCVSRRLAVIAFTLGIAGYGFTAYQGPGVADVVGFGGYLPEVHVEVDPARLQAFGLTLEDVRTALAKSNVNVGGGFLRHGDQEMVVRGVGYLGSASDIQNVVLASKA